jgi:hypothetical protein
MSNNQWTNFERADWDARQLNKVKEHIKSLGLPKEAIDRLMMEFKDDKIYMNNKYTVSVSYSNAPDYLHLSIKRNDKQPLHDWRDLQRIKNELCGTSCEAVELYPNKDRVLDTSNQYHLWCFPPKFKFPLGFTGRAIFDSKDLEQQQGNLNAKQRPIEDHHRDSDCPTIGILWSEQYPQFKG